VSLGSDFDGAVSMPFDVTGVVPIADALLAEGLGESHITMVLGRNALRVLSQVLPSGPANLYIDMWLPPHCADGDFNRTLCGGKADGVAEPRERAQALARLRSVSRHSAACTVAGSLTRSYRSCTRSSTPGNKT
jgi:hypothetical protein